MPDENADPDTNAELLPVLPGSVSAAHLRASAAALAEGTGPGRAAECVRDAGELAETLADLVAGQRHLARALAQLGRHLRESARSSERDAPDLAALAEVLAAAGSAAGYTADALAEGTPVVEHLCEFSGRDTRL